jgi:hypothetical protein
VALGLPHRLAAGLQLELPAWLKTVLQLVAKLKAERQRPMVKAGRQPSAAE